MSEEIERTAIRRAPSAPAPVPFGRYQLLRCLASGGMGEVFLARPAGIEGFQKLLVLKVLLPHLAGDEAFVRMFLDEGRLVAQLDHVNLAQLYDLGEVEGRYFIAMEYVRGESLQRLQRACHRDVSPQNILVSFDGTVKVIDFGIAKSSDRATRTLAGVVKGKAAYMSPEQARGLAVDRRTDIFALGIVLYELATGKRLFDAEGEVATLKAVDACQVADPRALEPTVDRGLADILLKALRRNPAERYPDAAALRFALEDWIARQQQPASNAQLSLFLHELFGDRLEQERRLETPAQQPVQSSLFPALERTAPFSAVTQTQESERPVRLGVFVLVGVLVGVLLAGLLAAIATVALPGPLSPFSTADAGPATQATQRAR